MDWTRTCRLAAATAGAVLAVACLAAWEGAWAQGANGSILVRVRAGGSDAQGRIKVLTATVEPTEVATGQSGTPISVPPGRYDVAITCTDLLDEPTQTLQAVQVQAGQTVEREASFPSGTITLHLRKGGRALKATPLTLQKASGEDLPNKARSEDALKLSPGRYSATVQFGKKQTQTITGIEVYDGAIRHIPADL